MKYEKRRKHIGHEGIGKREGSPGIEGVYIVGKRRLGHHRPYEVNAGSDIIVPMRDSRLWGLVKMYLEPIPSDYRPVLPGGEPGSIRIALFRTGKPVYSFPARKILTVHTLYRDHLSETGQKAVSRHLMHHFKQTFRAYMNGALSNNPDLEIADAIDEFCRDYHIENEKITVEMLRKDWYRFRLRCSNGAAIPVENSDF